MPDQSKKLDVLKSAIIAESRNEITRINDELKQRRENAVRAEQEKITAEIERYKAAKIEEITAREHRRVMTRITENKHRLLVLREQFADEVFQMVRDQLRVFVESPEYERHMVTLLKRAIDHLGYGFAAEVWLREQDMHLKDKLFASVSGVSLAFREGAFRLGGLRLICPSRGLRIDMSFDTAMQDLVGHFSELAGIHVDD